MRQVVDWGPPSVWLSSGCLAVWLYSVRQPSQKEPVPPPRPPCWPCWALGCKGPQAPAQPAQRGGSEMLLELFSSFSQASVAARPPNPWTCILPAILQPQTCRPILSRPRSISMSCHHLIPDRGSSAFPHVSRILMVIIVTITRPQPCPLRLLHFNSQVQTILSRCTDAVPGYAHHVPTTMYYVECRPG